LRIIVTSREITRLSAEQAYDVPQLDVPDPGHLPSLAALPDFEAVALFIERAKTVRPDFELTQENAAAVAEICARLDGLPLAIELAAARTRLLTPRQILERLDRRLVLLTGGSSDLPDRQRTLRGAVEWSYELLGEPERRLFERLAVFAGGWTLEAAESVCRPAELNVDLLDGLSSLADKSLVHPGEEDVEPRFEMLQVIREFALEQLDTRGEAAALRRRHAEEVMAFAERAGPELVRFEMKAWNRRLRLEEENLRAALRWAVEASEPDIGLRIASAIWRYWHYWGTPREGRDWLEALLSLADAEADVPLPVNVAKGSSALASLVYWLGDPVRTDELYTKALTIYRELGDEAGVTATLEAMAWNDVARGDPHAATARAEEAKSRYGHAGDRSGVARMHAWLVTGAFLMGFGVPADQALAATNEAIAAAREQGNAWDMINWQGELADIYRRIGDVPRAIHEFQATAELYHGLRYMGALPWLKLLARLELERGDAERAAVLAAVAARAVEDLGGELPEEITKVGDPLSDARGLVPENVYARAVAKGREMTFDEAVAFVMEG